MWTEPLSRWSETVAGKKLFKKPSGTMRQRRRLMREEKREEKEEKEE